MNIGLIDVDGHNFPNLALMKISAYHKSKKDLVEFATIYRKYDILYKSKVFSFTPDDENAYQTKKVIRGGAGYNIKLKLPKEIDLMFPDYHLYNCEHAYGFLTRGCNNNCDWCIVPEKEGKIKSYRKIQDVVGSSFDSAILMDNNILQSDYGIKQIEEIIKLKIRIDFNQGIDARLIDDGIAKLLSKVIWLHPVRLACDTSASIKQLKKAVTNLRWRNVTPVRYFVYCLVKDVNEAMGRVKEIKGIACDPFCQPYIDFRKNIEPTKEQKRFCRWVNWKSSFKSVWWEDYIWK